MESISKNLITKLAEARELVQESYQHSSEKHHILREKAKELKCHVQDDITSHLELLLNREVWLLDHIDLLFQLKEENIVSQKKELTNLLAKLEVYLEILQGGQVANDEFLPEINKLLLNIKTISAVESDCEISYFANNQSLGRAIKNFGHFSEDNQNNVQENQTRQETSPSSHIDAIRRHFNTIIMSPNEEWLAPRQEVETQVSATFTKEIQETNSSEWLFKKTQVRSDDEAKGSFIVDHFHKILSEPDSEWLKQDTTIQPSTGTPPCSRVPPNEGWLLAKDDGSSLESDVEVLSIQEDNMSDDWVVTRHENTSQIKEESNSWLSRRSNDTSRVDDQWLKRFRDSLDLRNSGWLSTTDDDYCEWLAPGADHCKDCPRNQSCPKETMKVFKNVWASPRDEWLNTAKDW